jgi:hypothetical protein
MPDSEPRAEAPGGRLAAALVLLVATLLWAAALWLTLHRPDLLEPYGAEARLAALAVAWVVPVMLTAWAWLSLRRARQALAEARAQLADAQATARRSKARATEAKGPPAPREIMPAAAERAAPEPLDADDEAAPDPVRDSVWAALDFPASEADTAGFEALRRAMAEDRQLALVIRTAQLALSLLAQEGVRLAAADAPDPPAPEILRQYVGGARGGKVAALGASADRESLARTVGRMRRDPAFRAAAQRFVAAFEAWLRTVVPDADDATLTRIAASRSGRAFRLLGRATGSFG